MEITKEIVEDLVEQELNELLDFNGKIYSVEYDEKTNIATVKLDVHIVEEDNYIGLRSY